MHFRLKPVLAKAFVLGVVLCSLAAYWVSGPIPSANAFYCVWICFSDLTGPCPPGFKPAQCCNFSLECFPETCIPVSTVCLTDD